MVNDVHRGNAIAESDTSRNVVVDQNGNIHVAFYGTNGIRMASSANRGASFGSSILVSNVNAECELAVDHNNTLYLAWVEGTNIMFTTSTDHTTFTTPRAVGTCSDSCVHMTVDAPYVYILPRAGGPLYRNTNSGIGAFTAVSVDSGRTFADVFVDPFSHTVYIETDDPYVRYFISNDYGASFGSAHTPGFSVYYPSIVGMFTATGKFMFIAGANNTGYRVNLSNHTFTPISMRTTILHGRSLVADNNGNLLNGCLSSTGLHFSISADFGATFTPLTSVAGSVPSASFAFNPIYGDVIAVYQDNGQIFCSIYDDELICTNTDVRLTLTATPTAIRPGETVTYAMGITNMSAEPANGIIVSNSLPSAISYTGGSALFSNQSGGVVTAEIGTLGPYSGTNLVLHGQANPGSSGILSNFCIVTLEERDVLPYNNQTFTFCSIKPALQVVCAHSASTPPVGTYTNPLYAVVTNSVTTPFENGGTQYHCSGWTMTGNTPTGGSNNNFIMTHTNDAVLTWLWEGPTNVYFGRAAEAHGSVTGSASDWYEINSTATVHATPLNHYNFSHWAGTVPMGKENDNPLTLDLDRTRTISAFFTPDTQLLTISTDCGTVDPSSGTHARDYGATFGVSAISPHILAGGTQYVCTGWSMSGHSPAFGESSSFSMTITNNAILHWYWGTTNVKLNAEIDGYGSLSGDTAGWYNRNTSITIAATEGPFEHFSGWSGDLPPALTNNNPLTLTMDRTRTIQARFTAYDPEIVVISSHGSPFPAIGANAIPLNTMLNASVNSPITNDPCIQYVCSGWTMMGNNPISGSGTSFVMTLTNNAEITWHWQTNILLQITNDGPGTITGVKTGWYPHGSSMMATAVPHNAFTPFLHWSGTIPSAQTNNNPLLIDMTQAHNITAHFENCESTLNILSEYGSPAPSVGTHTYICGTHLNPAAPAHVTPNGTNGARYSCTGWTLTGNTPSSGTNYHFSMILTNDATLTWNWGMTHYYYLGIEITGAGRVTGPSAGWYPANTSITLYAEIPQSDGAFLNWEQDGNQPVSTQLTFNLDSSQTVYAHFTDVYRNLTVASAHGAPTPSGTTSNLYWSRLPCRVNSPVWGTTGTYFACTGWTLTGNSPSTGTTTSFLLTPTNDALLIWNWNTNYLFNTVPEPGGQVFGSTSGWYTAQSTVTVTAKPDVGFVFTGWQGDVPAGQTHQNPLELTLSAPHSVTATFTYSRILTIHSTHGTPVPPAGTYTNAYGSSLNLRLDDPIIAGTYTSLVCSGWSMVGNIPHLGTNTIVTMTQTNNAALTWLWSTNVHLACSVVSNGTLTGATNTWNLLGQTNVIHALPDTGMAFAGWQGNVPTAQTNQNPLRLIMDHSRAITARFEQARYILEIRSAHGTCDPPPGTYTNSYGTFLANYMPSTTNIAGSTQFVCTGWTLTSNSPASGASSTAYFTITNNAILTWNWTTNVLLSSTTQGYGRITGMLSDWYPLGGSVTITAVPATNHLFLYWSGDVPSAQTNNQIITLTMDQARAVRANFTIIRAVDFAIHSIGAGSSRDRRRLTVEGSVQIVNIGTDAGDAGKLSVWANRPTPANCGEYGDQHIMVGIIKPGEIKTFTFTNLYPGAEAGLRSFRAFIDSDCAIIEQEERNNQYACNYTYLGPILDEFNFNAFALTNSVYLRWTAPTNCGLPNNNVRIVYNTSHYPDNAGDGTILFEGYTNMFTHTNCASLTSYFYTIWVNDGTYYIDPPEN